MIHGDDNDAGDFNDDEENDDHCWSGGDKSDDAHDGDAGNSTQ